jgi:tetratricopeptide (TPR) repeat protein
MPTSAQSLREKYLELFEKGVDLYVSEKYHDAIYLFDQLIQSPDIPLDLKVKSLRQKGNCLCRLQEYSKALHILDEALFLAKEVPAEKCWILACKGWCLYKQGNHQEAINCYDQAIRQVTDQYDLEYLQFESALVLEEFEHEKRDDFGERGRPALQTEMQRRLAILNRLPGSPCYGRSNFWSYWGFLTTPQLNFLSNFCF